jgi:hypothetical protein
LRGVRERGLSESRHLSVDGKKEPEAMDKLELELAVNDRNKGYVFLPGDGRACYPLILYAHGWGGNRNPNGEDGDLKDRLNQFGVGFVSCTLFGGNDDGATDYTGNSCSRWAGNGARVVRYASRLSLPVTDHALVGGPYPLCTPPRGN